ncbi:hypothetical protein ACLB2K_049269 [Fragaria x ananassa]
MWLAGRVFRVSSGANCTGNGLIGAATASFSRYFSRERAENLRKINPKVSFPEANSIATELYDVVKQHGPITIPNTWAQAKESGVSGLNSKTHMKILLKWMRGRKMLKLFPNQVGSNKKFLLCTLPEDPHVTEFINSTAVKVQSKKPSSKKKKQKQRRCKARMSEKGNCIGYAARDPSGVLSHYEFSRRDLGTDDVSIRITHCGVCYADVSWTRNKLGDSKYPLVPGHEIAGIVKEVGSNVQRFKVGDHVGVGTYVNSCRDCEYCNDALEVQCVKGSVFTFNGVDADGTITKGGYSSHIVVHDRYCYKIPDNYPLASAAPLLCAGITVYAPMMRHKMNQPGKSLGVIGLGGLGHMAVKFGKAFGLTVTVFSTSISKKEEALSQLGADEFVLSSDQEQMKGLVKSLDFIVDTASGDHLFDPYMALLKTSGILVLVGFPSEVKFSPASLILGMRTVSGSMTGGTKDTQEMIDFCAAHGIHPMIEVIPIQYANEAIDRLTKRDVKYRFVIDIENSLK